jgi:hypothetical protein
MPVAVFSMAAIEASALRKSPREDQPLKTKLLKLTKRNKQNRGIARAILCRRA